MSTIGPTNAHSDSVMPHTMPGAFPEDPEFQSLSRPSSSTSLSASGAPSGHAPSAHSEGASGREDNVPRLPGGGIPLQHMSPGSASAGGPSLEPRPPERQPRLPSELITNVASHVAQFKDRGEAHETLTNMRGASHGVHYAVDNPSLATDIAALRRNPGVCSRRDAGVQDARNGMPGSQANDENRVKGMFDRDDIAYAGAKTEVQNGTIGATIQNGVPPDQAFEQTFVRHGVEDLTDQRHIRHAHMNAALQAGVTEPQALLESGLTPSEHLSVTLHPRPGNV